MRLPILEALLEKLEEDDIILIEKDLVCLSLDQQAKLHLTLAGLEPVDDQPQQPKAEGNSVPSFGPPQLVGGGSQPHDVCLVLKYTPEVITSIQIDEFVEVMVHEIFSPSKFYVRIIDKGYNEQFRTMEHQMGLVQLELCLVK